MHGTSDGLRRIVLPRRTFWHRYQDEISEWFFRLVALVAVMVVFFIIIFVGKESLPVFFDAETQEHASLDKAFLPQVYKTGKEAQWAWQPVSKIPKYSVIPLLVGTLKVTLVALLFAFPLGGLASLFSSEFAPKRIREIIKPAVELLAGIPSVVLGFLALMILAPFLQQVFGFTYQLNAIVSGIAVGIAILPLIFTVCDDAFASVPDFYREASFALGANRFQTAVRVVFPAALPGVFAATVLGLGRAIGETMIVLMASGNAAIVSAKLEEPVRTMSATIAAEMLEVVFGDIHYTVLFFIGTLLFGLSFVVNLVGDLVIRRLKQRLTGSAA